MRDVRCFECKLPDDVKVRDMDDGKMTCCICGKHSYAKFNATGLAKS